MIMPAGQQLLLPAKPWFIWCSLIGALLLNMVQNMGLWGRAAWMPDLLAIVLVFWTIHQPLRIGIGVAFAFGLFMDVHQGSLLGQHALAYTVLSYFCVSVHRRLTWFASISQAAQIFPLFAAAHAVELTLRMLTGGSFPGIWMLLAPVLEAVLWPIASYLLIAPQMRAPNPDENRPL